MGKAPMGQQQTTPNDLMRTLALMQEMKYNKERAAYIGTEKETAIEKRQQDIQERANKQADVATQRDFSTETGLPFKEGIDEPTVAQLRAVRREQVRIPDQPTRREPQGFLGGLFSPTNAAIPSVQTQEDKDLQTGRAMGAKAAMVPSLFEGAHRQAQIRGFSDPASPTYSPEVDRALGTKVMRPEDVDALAKESQAYRKQVSESRKEQALARKEEAGVALSEHTRNLADAYALEEDPTKRRALVQQIAVANGHGMDVLKGDEDRQVRYVEMAKHAADRTDELVKHQKGNKFDLEGLGARAKAATAANIAMSQLNNSPMTDMVSIIPAPSKMPLAGALGGPTHYGTVTRVGVPTEFARAHSDNTLEGLIRAPLKQEDPPEKQAAQIAKQGQYFAWKMIQQDPSLLGNQQGFERAVSGSALVSPQIKQAALQHMGVYMQMNPDAKATRIVPESEQDVQKPPQGVGLVPSDVQLEEKYGPYISKAIPPESFRQGTRNIVEGGVNAIKGLDTGPTFEKVMPAEQDVRKQTGKDKGLKLPSLTKPRAEAVVPPQDVQLSDPRILQAIRETEMGGPGREMGVLSVKAPDMQSQVKAAAQTVRNTEQRYTQNMKKSPVDENGRYTDEFIQYLSQGGPGYPGYASIGAENDPTNLNKNHFPNLLNRYKQLVGR